MRILIANDSFKNSLSSKTLAQIIENQLKSFAPAVEIVVQSLADGGEGSLESLSHHIQADPVFVDVLDPLFRQRCCYFLKSGSSAYIEMAQASGLERVSLEDLNCLQSSSYGTGQLIRYALLLGVTEIFLFIGGSATHDLGIGMAEALGFKFFNQSKPMSRIVPKMIPQIDQIDEQNARDFLKAVKFTVLADVVNPLTGPNGAAHIYAAQKGADSQQIDFLENMSHYIKELIGLDDQFAGAGAAGGLAYGGRYFLEANIQSGIKFLAELTRLEKEIQKSDMVITGEGSIDDQSTEGKLVGEVARLSRLNGIPCIAICALNQLEKRKPRDLDLNKIYSLFKEKPKKIDIAETISSLKTTILEIAKEWKIV